MAARTPDPSWADQKLVDACLAGDEAAWSTLVDRYKRLVYSIVVKAGARPEEASDLFQGVWLDAYNGLASLRKKESVRSWLISLTTHRCYQWRQQTFRRRQRESSDVEDGWLEANAILEPGFADELELQQVVREGITELSERCQEMIQLLFFRQPPMPYQEVAAHLGLATGSIGFIRGRCLKKLQKALEGAGLG